jgi:hypothetical protein
MNQKETIAYIYAIAKKAIKDTSLQGRALAIIKKSIEDSFLEPRKP